MSPFISKGPKCRPRGRQAGCTTRVSFGDELTLYKIQNAKCIQQKADEGNSRGKTKKYQTEDKAEATENRVGRQRTHEDRRNSKTRDTDEPTKSKGEWCQ